ncbi:MAG TPA: fumarylacetoacetase [Saprospiraceae bacterium]|nr:fumarylacetoacetase [Saprospiraceae bacterium]
MSASPVPETIPRPAASSDFSIHNIPFGIFSTNSDPRLRACTAYGDYVIDLQVMHNLAFFKELDFPVDVFSQSTLNDFIALGKEKTSAVRRRIQELLKDERAFGLFFNYCAVPMEEANLHLPIFIRDYTDFYSSIEHATNVGSLFRDPKNALLPNWKRMPIGYHGRSSSIVVSGTPIKRPYGQSRPLEEGGEPQFGPSKLLDFELEMGFVIGKATKLGQRIPIAQAEDYIFGMVLFNDWSARDIQAWEYVPLGPFLGKNFASTMSPWIVTMEALEPFRVDGPVQEPAVLPYLQFSGRKNYDIHLEVIIKTDDFKATVCNSNFKYMYWNMPQQLAHHTINGCNVNIGDLYASGTISGKTKTSYGSMLELSWRGSQPLPMPDGSERKFIHDGDTVIMHGYAEKDGIRVGFGEASGKILAADPMA